MNIIDTCLALEIFINNTHHKQPTNLNHFIMRRKVCLH